LCDADAREPIQKDTDVPVRRITAAVFAATLLFPLSLIAQERKPSSSDARVYIIWPPDGQVIEGGKFWLRMGLSGMGIAPAGLDVPNTGHHHVLIDTPLPPLDAPIPNDRNHVHFGAGQTEARVELPPGRHTLQLLLGDVDHVPHDPPLMSPRITVIVPDEGAPAPQQPRR
jgi:hypothetical protein